MVDYTDHDDNGIIRGFTEGDDIQMVDTKQVAITLDILKVLNKSAIDNNYNRQIVDTFFDDADGRFPCYLVLYMTHMHKQGVPCEAHIRTGWEVVMKDQSKAKAGQVTTHQIYVDIPMSIFNVLPNTPQARALATDFESADLDKITKEMLDSIKDYLSSESEEE